MKRGLLFAAVCLFSGLALSSQNPAKKPAQNLTEPPAAANPAKPDAMDTYLRNLAGSNALECPRASFGGDFRSSNDCALAASALARPFYVRYEMESTGDHEIAIGLVGASDGKSYMVGYNSAGIKQHPAKSTFTSMELEMISMPGSKHPMKPDASPQANPQASQCLRCHQDQAADERFAQTLCYGHVYVGEKSGRAICSNPPPWDIKPGCGGSCHKGRVQQQ
jgi:hypothetical protein